MEITQVQRFYSPYGGYRDVYGEVYEERFVLPQGMNGDKVFLFPVIDLQDLKRRMSQTTTDWDARPKGFGVSWGDKGANFLQVFGYTVASSGQMERIFEDPQRDPGGYFYVINKSRLFSRDRKFLPAQLFSPEVEVLGWEYHSSRYLPYAEVEAAAVTCQVAEEFGLELSERIGKEFEAVLPDQNYFRIKEEVKKYKGKKPRLFTPEQLTQLRPKLGV